jgi:hypothetical protein
VSEKILKILLSELKIVRIKCKGKHGQNGDPCAMIYEVPIENLASVFQQNCCPICGKPFYRPDSGNPLPSLAAALQMVASVNDTLEIEFVIPNKDGSPPGLLISCFWAGRSDPAPAAENG